MTYTSDFMLPQKLSNVNIISLNTTEFLGFPAENSYLPC